MTASTDAPTKDQLLDIELNSAPAMAHDLELYLFLRGFGDVEHIAIVGVDEKNYKIRLLYVN